MRFNLKSSNETFENSHLNSTKSKLVFFKKWSILQVDRIEILKHLTSHRSDLKSEDLENIDWDGIAKKTDGFVIQDLVDLVNKSVFQAFKRSGTVLWIWVVFNSIIQSIYSIFLQQRRKVPKNGYNKKGINIINKWWRGIQRNFRNMCILSIDKHFH